LVPFGIRRFTDQLACRSAQAWFCQIHCGAMRVAINFMPFSCARRRGKSL
jgi:hypothetical protein